MLTRFYRAHNNKIKTNNFIAKLFGFHFAPHFVELQPKCIMLQKTTTTSATIRTIFYFVYTQKIKKNVDLKQQHERNTEIVNYEGKKNTSTTLKNKRNETNVMIKKFVSILDCEYRSSGDVDQNNYASQKDVADVVVSVFLFLCLASLLLIQMILVIRPIATFYLSTSPENLKAKF